MRAMPPSRQVTSIDFADTFAHSLLGATDRIKNISHLLVEALVTQRLTSGGYACGFAALAGYADSTVRFTLSSLLIALASSVKR